LRLVQQTGALQPQFRYGRRRPNSSRVALSKQRNLMGTDQSHDAAQMDVRQRVRELLSRTG